MRLILSSRKSMYVQVSVFVVWDLKTTDHPQDCCDRYLIIRRNHHLHRFLSIAPLIYLLNDFRFAVLSFARANVSLSAGGNSHPTIAGCDIVVVAALQCICSDHSSSS